MRFGHAPVTNPQQYGLCKINTSKVRVWWLTLNCAPNIHALDVCSSPLCPLPRSGGVHADAWVVTRGWCVHGAG